MGILSDFFIANPSQITEDRFHQGPAGTFPTVQSKGLTPVEMDELLQSVRSGASTEETAHDDFPLVLTCPGGESWVIACPSELRDALAAASGDDLTRYASQWATFEEFEWARDDLSSLVSLLQDLAILARVAQTRGESLYLWMSL